MQQQVRFYSSLFILLIFHSEIYFFTVYQVNQQTLYSSDESKHTGAGIVSSEKNTNGSQFFITFWLL